MYLEPCPFCGSEDVNVRGGRSLGDPCAVKCEKCGAQGVSNIYLQRGEEAAAEAWNTRAVKAKKE